ncbi:MAG: HAD-IA family hydrolase [Pseudomonadota bacterium]|nr:HAD-IA family hydrolase [Rubrivivax sp.]MCA3257365.1 HAD-IA family hydrolase [Rubrivivax sp.]MCZ8031855.1 HAD-IA family hydrolase [Rubrivivax sp.]
MSTDRAPGRPRVWLFDLDDTLHDAATASMPHLHVAFGEYIQQHLGLGAAESDALRRRYWLRYGATLLGLVRHHGVEAAHFLHHTHRLPGLEQRVRGHRADLAALDRLPGRRYILTNAPAAYAGRVLDTLGIRHRFDGVIAIEQMHMFGRLRPKPDARMLRWVAARLRVPPQCCVLVEDTLVHQKSARRLGIGTVWMQRWLPRRDRAGRPLRLRGGRPAYVDRRVRALRELLRTPP